MKVPFLDLKAQYQSLKKEIDQAVEETLAQASFVGGEKVQAFEAAFSNHLGAKHCVSCANGTDALEIALRAVGVGRGDEVVVPAMSWIATSEAVTNVGATPIFADILPGLWTIDPREVEKKITPKTKAILPVHLYGQPAAMDEIMEMAHDKQLKVIEDAAQAHGAQFQGQSVGNWGDMATFSFYPSKNLGAYGDAGAIVTNDEQLAHLCRMTANHGQVAKHQHQMEGRNSRMDTLQAAILGVKLPHLDAWTKQRIACAEYYDRTLTGLPIHQPIIESKNKHAFHLYVIQTHHRARVKEKLAQAGISTQIHYPKALPALAPYRLKNHSDDYPVAQQLAAQGLSLPLYPEMTRAQQDHVVQTLVECHRPRAD